VFHCRLVAVNKNQSTATASAGKTKGRLDNAAGSLFWYALHMYVEYTICRISIFVRKILCPSQLSQKVEGVELKLGKGHMLVTI